MEQPATYRNSYFFTTHKAPLIKKKKRLKTDYEKAPLPSRTSLPPIDVHLKSDFRLLQMPGFMSLGMIPVTYF